MENFGKVVRCSCPRNGSYTVEYSKLTSGWIGYRVFYNWVEQYRDGEEIVVLM